MEAEKKNFSKKSKIIQIKCKMQKRKQSPQPLHSRGAAQSAEGGREDRRDPGVSPEELGLFWFISTKFLLLIPFPTFCSSFPSRNALLNAPEHPVSVPPQASLRCTDSPTDNSKNTTTSTFFQFRISFLPFSNFACEK